MATQHTRAARPVATSSGCHGRVPRAGNSLDGDGGDGRGDLADAAALHQLDGLLHLHLVVEGDELGLLGALPRDQALLHVLLVEAVQPSQGCGRGGAATAQPRPCPRSPALPRTALLPSVLGSVQPARRRPGFPESLPSQSVPTTSSTCWHPLGMVLSSCRDWPLTAPTLPQTCCGWCGQGVQPCSPTCFQSRAVIPHGESVCGY